jgi:hypothetical protein
VFERNVADCSDFRSSSDRRISPAVRKHKITIDTFTAPPKSQVRCNLDIYAAPEHVTQTAFGTFRSAGAFESLACSMPIGYQIVGYAGPRGQPPTINV